MLALRSNDTYIVPTRDAGYSSPVPDDIRPRTAMRNTTAFVAIGVNHMVRNVTNNPSSFSSVGVTVFSPKDGCFGFNCIVRQTKFTQWLTGEELQGSAQRYLPDHPLADSLFAVDVFPKGTCRHNRWSSDWCVEYDRTASPVVEEGRVMYPTVAERIYSGAVTGVGGSAIESITAQGLVFNMDGPCATDFSLFTCDANSTLIYGAACDSTCGGTCVEYVSSRESDEVADLLVCKNG